MDKKHDDNTEEILEPEEGEIDTDEENTNEVGEELQKLQELTAQLDNQLKRSLADYQNLQRRVQEEKTGWVKTANKDLLLKLFPVLDTLMLAQKHTNDQNFVLTVQQFLQVLEQEGVKKIKTVGEKFDPTVMEAVTTKQVDKEEGKVVEELRAGYMLYDTVLRPAQVIVGS